MGDKKDKFHEGEKVEKAGTYVCEICHTEGGVHTHEFKKGEEFPVCMNCGDATQWKKAEEEEEDDEDDDEEDEDDEDDDEDDGGDEDEDDDQ
ncbi:MAG: hypothetical protein ABIK85_06575 [Candidatus Eisenbacteria bacterium]